MHQHNPDRYICLNYCPKGERSDNYSPTQLLKNKNMKKDIILCGVGGDGIVSVAKIISDAAPTA